MSIRNVRRLRGTVNTIFGPVQEAPAGSIPLWSFSQNPSVPNNPSPIYPVGSPQYLAAIASGATPTPSYTPEQIASMTQLPGGCPASCIGVTNNVTCCPYQYFNPLDANNPNAPYTTSAQEANLQAYAAAYQASGSPAFGTPAFNALIAQYGITSPSTAAATPTPTNISPISATPTPAAASNFQYTADEETVQQLLYQYGDTWDNPQTIVNQLYAAGIAPGTVSQANALPYLTDIAAAATTTTTSSLATTLESIPAWGWAAIGIGALVMFGGK